MIGAQISPLRSVFDLRTPLRQGRLFAVLDATGFDALADLLDASGLENGSLFLGEDAVMLRGEAPFIVALTAENRAAAKEVFQRANNPHAGFLCVVRPSDEPPGIDQLRRHWKKWLSVRIPNEEALVLFRFFDARIALAFLASLTPSDAAAFLGPNEALIALRGQTTVEARLAVPAKPRRVGAGAWYEMTPAQMDAFSEVAGAAFADKFRRYMREIWWDRFETASAEQLDEMREHAIARAGLLDLPLLPQVIVDLAIVDFSARDVLDDPEFYFAQVRGKIPPSAFSSILVSAAKGHMAPEAGDRMFARAAAWSSFR